MTAKVFVNASEHVYNFHLTEVLYLRNYARANGYLFSSMIGGCESIRDLQQCKLLGVDAVECSLIESVFAFGKLCGAVATVFSPELSPLPIHSPPSLFLSIDTPDAVARLPELRKEVDRLNCPYEIIPVFNRRSLIKSMYSYESDNYDVQTYRAELACLIKQHTCLFSRYGISGGVTQSSLGLLAEDDITPHMLRLGLFSLLSDKSPLAYATDLDVAKYHFKETLLLDSIRSALKERYELITTRQHHLMKYLLTEPF